MTGTNFKLLLSVPISMKEEMDLVASELGQSRSRFIRDGVTRHLDYYRRRKRQSIRSLISESLGNNARAE
jgi:metal-responsive CopG/Arc/MetJ family transcriptional regulator